MTAEVETPWLRALGFSAVPWLRRFVLPCAGSIFVCGIVTALSRLLVVAHPYNYYISMEVY